jgi:hypothetical protein
MPKKAVSLTLDESNLLWLRGRGYGRGNLSAAIDELITEARTGRLGETMNVRTVVGSIDLTADDPLLEGADIAMRDLFTASLSRPMRVRESGSSYRPSRPSGSRHRG